MLNAQSCLGQGQQSSTYLILLQLLKTNMEIPPEKGHKQPRNHIANTHQYLNFIKKNHRLAQAIGTSNQYEKNQLMFPPPLQVTKNNSVFVLKDNKKEYRVEKASNSLHKPTYHLKVNNNPQDTQYLSAQIINEIIDRKNKEIQASMYREKQCMSEIVYNYSQFRSMESQFYRLQKSKKRSQKLGYKHKDSVKLPEVSKNNQDIFTIEYDSEGKKIVKVDLKKLEQNRLKQSGELIVKQKSLSRDLKSVYTDKEFTKRNELHLFKRRRHNNQFGIQIKSINNKILDSDNYLENSGLKLRRQLYEIVPESNTKKQDRLKQLRESEDRLLEVMEREEATEPAEIRQYKSQSVEFKMVSSRNILATNNFNLNKLSLKGFENNKEQADFETRSIPESSFKQEEGLQKEKEKYNQSISKRQLNRKNIILHQKQTTVYDQKISSYRQFLFLMNLVHKKYDNLFLGESNSFKTQDKYKYYIGLGNNSMLVKGLMKRRFWWMQEDDYKKVNFAWTQLKITHFYQLQKKSQRADFDSKAQTNDHDLKKKKLFKKDSDIKSPLKGGVLFRAPLPQDKDKILTNADKKILQLLESTVPCSESMDKITKYSTKLKYWQHNPFSSINSQKNNEKMHNHLQFNHFIGNKKALYYNLKRYYELRKKNVFQIIPLTFHIRQGTKDTEFAVFSKEFRRLQSLKYQQRKKKDDQKMKKIKNVWIVKPGQLSNRGNGIVVIDQLYSFVNILKKQEKHANGDPKTYIVQKYIENPLLYKGRKFDIRHYMMITRLHGLMRAYWYGQGYIRTSSSSFDLDDVSDQMIHLTNDAIQKNSTFYGKHEEGNKLSYNQFQRYLDQTYPDEKISFAENIYPKMKSIATDAIKSTYLQLDCNSMEHNFEIFGLDFMIDQNFDVWLIEVNTNPCLQLSSKLLGRIIPNMVEQALKLSIDVIFPPPVHYPNSQKYLAPDNTLGRLMYQLIFDEARDGKELVQLYKGIAKIDYGGEVKEDEQVYENDGKQIELGADIN